MGYRPSAVAAAAILCAADEIADLPVGDVGDPSNRFNEWVCKVISSISIVPDSGYLQSNYPISMLTFRHFCMPRLHDTLLLCTEREFTRFLLILRGQ